MAGGTMAGGRSAAVLAVFAIAGASAAAGARAQGDVAPLFASDSTLTVTLATDFHSVLKDRKQVAPYHAGRLIVAGDTLPVQVKTRGIFRLALENCAFPPLRIHFEKHGKKHTPFSGQRRLKLTTHCRDDKTYEQYVRMEYEMYRIYNVLTPLSFRVRLARVTYVDTAGKMKPVTQTGFFIEDEGDMAARNGDKTIATKGATLGDLDPTQLALMTWFEFYIGNTDWSIPALHNVVLVQDSVTGEVRPVPHDFDFAGAVNTSYAAPDPKLPIANVRERIYRGRCGSPEDFAPVLARFTEQRAAIEALFGDQSGIEPKRREEVLKYLADFYKQTADRKSVEHEIKRWCKPV